MSSAEPATFVVELTPPGRGAVASVLVAGPAAEALVERLFRPATPRPLVERPPGNVSFGRWNAPDGEEIVVARRDAGRVEIHCHGGRAAPRAIVASLVALGAVERHWQAWTRDEQPDPIVAEAILSLAAARTERSAAILLTQAAGSLRRAVDQARAELAAGRSAQAERHLAALLRWAPLGLHLVEPWNVVLAGPPNVGKSSLVNALLGYDRAIVHEQPGTTRDVVTAATALCGWPVRLSDTAGLQPTNDPVEAAGVALAHARRAAADLVLLVFDRSRSWTASDERLAREHADAIVVWNKADLPPDTSTGRVPGILTSALAGTGLDQLQRAIAERLVPEPPPCGAAMPFTAAQVASLQQARALAAAEDARGALAVLDSDAPWRIEPREAR